jgi:hypothetical protein
MPAKSQVDLDPFAKFAAVLYPSRPNNFDLNDRLPLYLMREAVHFQCRVLRIEEDATTTI